MKIDEWYQPKNIFDCEIETLQFLKDNFSVHAKFPQLANDAQQYYSRNYARLQSDNKLGFHFESELPVIIEGKEGTAHIGANITISDESSYEDVSYSLTICNAEKPKARLLRKYHFDYALPDSSRNQIQRRQIKRKQVHPVFHLQYAGKLSPRLGSLNLEHEHVDPWLSEPRLCYFPMCLALLINLVLKEFPSEINQRFIELSEWRTLIRKNENILLAPYYKMCHNFFSSRTSETLFINDFYYGK